MDRLTHFEEFFPLVCVVSCRSHFPKNVLRSTLTGFLLASRGLMSKCSGFFQRYFLFHFLIGPFVLLLVPLLLRTDDDDVSRQAVIKKARVTCKCHGVSGSCKISLHLLPFFI